MLYGQVVDVAGDSQWCGHIGCKGLVLDAASSSHGICQEGVVRKPKMITEDFLRRVIDAGKIF